MAASMSKEEYLKRYLSGGEDSTVNLKKKRRKKKPPVPEKIVPRSRIVDDDVDFHSLLPENINNTLDEDIGDNDPTVAEIIDERPEHVKLLETYRQDERWKTLNRSKGEDKFGVVGTDSDDDTDKPTKLTKPRNDSDSDQSPVRTKRGGSDSDQSPVRKNNRGSDSDQSPVRKKRRGSDSDQSPARKKKRGSDSDQSPVRKNRNDSDSDQSPVRKKRRGSDSDQSPPRKRTVIQKRHSKNSDTSSKHKHDSDSDLKVPRKKSKAEVTDKKGAKPTKTLGGAKAGLSSAKEMRSEAEKLKKKEDAAFQKIGANKLGKDAQTVYRDKSGKRRNLQAEKDQQDAEDAKKAAEIEKYEKWGRGLKQQENQEKSLMEAIHEANKPLARYKNDEDLDEHLKNMERAEDPMLAFIKKKKSKQNNKPEKPRYKGPAPPPNRFNIQPGYRWDGVNRTNGFEAQIFSKLSDQKAMKSMAYKWSVEEM